MDGIATDYGQTEISSLSIKSSP